MGRHVRCVGAERRHEGEKTARVSVGRSFSARDAFGRQSRIAPPTFVATLVLVASLPICPLPQAVGQMSLATRQPHSKLLDPTYLKDTFPRLKAVWEGEQSAILTARFKFRSLDLAGPLLRHSVLRDQLLTVLQPIDLVGHPDEIRTVLAAIANKDHPGFNGTWAKPWMDREFLAEGERRKVADDDSVQVLDSQSLVLSRRFTKNVKQINIFPSGRALHTPRLEEFIFVPSPQVATSVLAGRLAPVRVSSIPNLVSLSTRKDPYSIEMVIDPTTGDCVHYIYRNKNSAVRNEIIQHSFVAASDGIRYPTCSIRAKYDVDQLMDVRITLIDQAIFNEPIGEHEFQVSARKGDTLVDERRPDVKYQPRRVAIPMNDVTRAEAAVPQLKPSARRVGVSFLLVLNLLVFSGLAWFLYRRRARLK